jgi:predicted nucleotidyltransferase
VPESSFDELIEAMKAAAKILNDAEIDFVLGGGLSAWARGGPRSEHDVDFLIKPEDADAVLQAFEDAGWQTERPPEGWLYKTWHENGALVDLIFDPASGPITQEIIDRAHEGEVMALRARVATLEDVLVSKLMAMREQEPNFGSLLEWSRALREQIDWPQVRERTQDNPFAKAFFVLIQELGIVSLEEELAPGSPPVVRP